MLQSRGTTYLKQKGLVFRKAMLGPPCTKAGNKTLKRQKTDNLTVPPMKNLDFVHRAEARTRQSVGNIFPVLQENQLCSRASMGRVQLLLLSHELKAALRPSVLFSAVQEP